MSSQLLNRSYSLAALLIHGAKQEVTTDRIKAVFAVLNLEYSPKIAAMFALSSDKYSNMLSCSGGAAPVQGTASAAAPAAAAEEEKSTETDDAVLEF